MRCGCVVVWTDNPQPSEAASAATPVQPPCVVGSRDHSSATDGTRDRSPNLGSIDDECVVVRQGCTPWRCDGGGSRGHDPPRLTKTPLGDHRTPPGKHAVAHRRQCDLHPKGLPCRPEKRTSEENLPATESFLAPTAPPVCAAQHGRQDWHGLRGPARPGPGRVRQRLPDEVDEPAARVE